MYDPLREIIDEIMTAHLPGVTNMGRHFIINEIVKTANARGIKIEFSQTDLVNSERGESSSVLSSGLESKGYVAGPL